MGRFPFYPSFKTTPTCLVVRRSLSCHLSRIQDLKTNGPLKMVEMVNTRPSDVATDYLWGEGMGGPSNRNSVQDVTKGPKGSP